MSAINFIKNNLLFVFFLCAFIVPVGVVYAVENSVTNTSTGSYYYIKTESSGSMTGETGISSTKILDNDGSNVNNAGLQLVNLFSKNQTVKSPVNYQVEALKIKLEVGGSSFDREKLSGKNVFVVNNDNNSTFTYDPTPNNRNNNDELILGTATNKGNFLVPKIPVLKDQKNISPTSTDLNTGNGFLNYVDQVQGLAIGTTVSNKNNFYNLTKAKELSQIKIDEAASNRQQTYADWQAAIKNNSAPDEIARLQDLDEAATNQVRSTGAEASRINRDYNIAEAAKFESAKVKEDISCSSILNLTSSFCLLTIISKITNVIFKLTSFLAYIAGTLFDYSLEFSINSAEFFKKLGVVEITWSFIRDILNMTFIFILLWTAIQILITNDAKYNAKKILINVVLVAILMNFSLFAAKLIVDASNVVSLKMYEAMKANTGKKGSSISVRIMNTVGVETLYNITEIFNEKSFQAEGTCAKNPGAMITISVMGSIFLIVLILALGLAAILFLIRLVNIIFLFIKSPLWVWGYVIPGNSMMEKIKNNWQADMKHVVTFPILYLFWMLVAVIIFEKIGTATKDLAQGDGGLLGLICKNPENAGGSASISLVAIFVIVIIFMMKAIEYGVKHSNDGSGEGFGGKIASTVSNKFAGYQTAMTTGLAKKAGTLTTSAAYGASVGAAKVPLRTLTGLAGGVHSFRKKEGFLKGAGDGFFNPGINLKEMTAGTVRSSALGLRGVPIVGAALAKKAVVLQAQATKERKEINDKITKGPKEVEENLLKLAAEQYKPDTQEQWEKKNGAIGVDAAKADKYREHVQEQIEKRAKVSFGNKDIIHEKNKDGKKHLTAIMDKALVREEVKDAGGKITGIKFKLNNREVATGLGEVSKYHTTGAGATKINKKGLWKPYRTQKAEAKAKAAEAVFKAEEGKYQKDEDEKVLEAMIKKIKEKLALLPEDKTIDEMIKDPTSPGLDKKAGKESREFNTARRNLEDAEYSYSGNIPSDIRRDLEEKVYDAGEKVKEVREKVNKDLIKKNEDLAKKAAAAEKAKEK